MTLVRFLVPCHLEIQPPKGSLFQADTAVLYGRKLYYTPRFPSGQPNRILYYTAPFHRSWQKAAIGRASPIETSPVHGGQSAAIAQNTSSC